MNFLTTTIIGGLVFLLPIDSLGGVTIVNIVAALIVLFVSFLAGLLAPTQTARNFATAIENAVQSRVPGYTLIKGATNKLTSPGTEGIHTVV